jgi:hypothetical protein
MCTKSSLTKESDLFRDDDITGVLLVQWKGLNVIDGY